MTITLTQDEVKTLKAVLMYVSVFLTTSKPDVQTIIDNSERLLIKIQDIERSEVPETATEPRSHIED